jgi:hypothetical protein
MVSFFVTNLELLEAIRRAAHDKDFRALSFMTLFLLLCGIFFYSYAEEWNLLDSFYFCVMTMTTIGYGDLTPTTNASKTFTIVYAFVSIGTFVSLATKLASALFMHNHKSQGNSD